MKVSDYIIDTLASEGVTHIFEICGGALGHLLDSLYGRTDIQTVSMHHEMAAAIAAEGYARASGNIGVAMATSGPGATNLITGIGSCFFDSIPCLFLTGQVNTYEYKFNKAVRQIGFQETDIVSIVKPIVKCAKLIVRPENIQKILTKSIEIAKNGRPGPVLLDLPLDIQRSNIERSRNSLTHEAQYQSQVIDDQLFDQLWSEIQSSSRPVILSGGGVRSSKATKELLEFAHMTGIPVAVSLMGIDTFPHDDPLYIGMIGTYGNRYANLAVANADLLLAFGSRFDTRQTGTQPETFARGAKKIHVDIDPFELNNKIRVAYPIHANVRDFLLSFTVRQPAQNVNKFSNWIEVITKFKTKYPINSTSNNKKINPHDFFLKLSKLLPNDAILCVDVGQHQMWAAQTIVIKQDQRFLTQGGMASMGSALPMAIGASFAKPDHMIVVVTGDGGFQLNIQELETVSYHHLPIKIILLNNSSYGMVRQFQEQYFNGRLQSSVLGYSLPDFQKVVHAYKIRSKRIVSSNKINAGLKSLLSDFVPGFLEVVIDGDFKVTPKLAVNKPIEDQEPLLGREELRSNMMIELLPE